MSAEDEKLEIVSHFPGRLRVRARKFREEPAAAKAVAQSLGREPGVLSVRASALTGSILVLYDPHAAEVHALVAAALSASGLSEIAPDAEEHASAAALAERIKQTFAGIDTRLFQAADGRLDLRTAVPGALLVSGLATLLVKSFVQPQWYDLVFWSYVTFNNIHLTGQGTSSDAR